MVRRRSEGYDRCRCRCQRRCRCCPPRARLPARESRTWQSGVPTQPQGPTRHCSHCSPFSGPSALLPSLIALACKNRGAPDSSLCSRDPADEHSGWCCLGGMSAMVTTRLCGGERRCRTRHRVSRRTCTATIARSWPSSCVTTRTKSRSTGAHSGFLKGEALRPWLWLEQRTWPAVGGG